MTFCGQFKTTWQRLTEISQAGVDNCTLLKPPSMKGVRVGHVGVHVWMVYRVRIDCDPGDIAVLN